MSSTTSPAGHRVNILVLIFTLVAGLTVFCRLFTRTVVIRNAGSEDALIAVAMVSIELLVLFEAYTPKGLLYRPGCHNRHSSG
jgi:hypothetical protein